MEVMSSGNKLVDDMSSGRAYRILKARGVVFTESQMDKYGIRGIFNYIGERDRMTAEVMKGFMRDCLSSRGHVIGSREIAFMEYKDEMIPGKSNVVGRTCSVIVFYDDFYLNFYLISMSGDYIKEDGKGKIVEIDKVLLTLMN